MASNVLQTARIFEDPETPATSKPHKRNTSVGDVLRGHRKECSPTKVNHYIQNTHAGPSPLGERHINSPPQPKKIPLKSESETRPPMHKKTESATSLKSFLMRREKSNDGSSTDAKNDYKPKKQKSSTNLAGLLKKRSKKDLKENQAPLSDASPLTPAGPTPTPLWAQFATQPLEGPNGAVYYPQGRGRSLAEEIELYTPKDYSEYRPADQRNFYGYDRPETDIRPPQRPFLEHKSSRSSIFTENLEDEHESPLLQHTKSDDQSHHRPASPPSGSCRSPVKVTCQSPMIPDVKKRSSKILDTIAALNMRSRKGDCSSPSKESFDQGPLSPQELDSAMENMLGRYDIPQNLRDQLRNLKPEVKAGLMKGERIGSGSSVEGEELRPSARRTEKERPSSKDSEGKDRKQSRSRSRPRSRILSLPKRGDTSPVKQEGTGRMRSKSRPKSIDLNRPMSATAMSSTASLGSLGAPDSATTPGDFIHYLREVQKPELVEVGKIHKLRVLLRNESVTWTDTFVNKGGMDEIVQLLYRIMKLEWREEHEDTLLHHALSCLKGLSTTSLAMQRLEALGGQLFPALLKMLFDPERKGPAEYTTRGVIVSLIFSYLSATLHARPEVHADRAREVLSILKDSEPTGNKQVLDFVSQMHVSRPYRVWCKEVTNVTREVFWIFLHHMNVVPILEAVNEGETTFVRSFFPAARAPHPAAPYVGGVEWEATQYLANHLDLLNAILASIPTADERNSIREDMRQSGWEKVMGGSLRTCKEKFYCGVHDGLRAWVAAANRDGWFVEDVRAGPPRESASPKKRSVKTNAQDAPQIALDMNMPAMTKKDDKWL